MTQQRVGGIIELAVNGEVQQAKGAFTYNLGRSKREAVVGADGVHGYKEVPQVAFFEGAITDRQDLDLDGLVTIRDATATLSLANGKIVALFHAWYAGEGTVNTEEGEIGVRFEGLDAEELPL